MSTTNTTYDIKWEGVDEFVQKLNRIESTLRKRVAKEAAHAGALQIQNYARLEITRSGKFSRHQTGGLANSISTSSRMSADGGEAEISVGKVYARIQEFGGTIRPLPTNRRGLLFWRDPDTGELRAAKQVTLPPRPYLRPAMTDHQSDVLESMGNVVDAYLETERE